MNKFISGKKILALLLALVFVVTALASCAAGGPNDSTQQSGSESSSSSSSLLYNDAAPIKPDASLNAELSKPQADKPASNKAESIVTKLEDGGIEVMAKANASLAPLTLTTYIRY